MSLVSASLILPHSSLHCSLRSIFLFPQVKAQLKFIHQKPWGPGLLCLREDFSLLPSWPGRPTTPKFLSGVLSDQLSQEMRLRTGPVPCYLNVRPAVFLPYPKGNLMPPPLGARLYESSRAPGASLPLPWGPWRENPHVPRLTGLLFRVPAPPFLLDSEDFFILSCQQRHIVLIYNLAIVFISE